MAVQAQVPTDQRHSRAMDTNLLPGHLYKVNSTADFAEPSLFLHTSLRNLARAKVEKCQVSAPEIYMEMMQKFATACKVFPAAQNLINQNQAGASVLGKRSNHPEEPLCPDLRACEQSQDRVRCSPAKILKTIVPPENLKSLAQPASAMQHSVSSDTGSDNELLDGNSSSQTFSSGVQHQHQSLMAPPLDLQALKAKVEAKAKAVVQAENDVQTQARARAQAQIQAQVQAQIQARALVQAQAQQQQQQQQQQGLVACIQRAVTRRLLSAKAEVEFHARKAASLESCVGQLGAELVHARDRMSAADTLIRALRASLEHAHALAATAQDFPPPPHLSRLREGHGDSEEDDTNSCCSAALPAAAPPATPQVTRAAAAAAATATADPASPPGQLNATAIMCRACGQHEVSVLLLPCRHLCVCRSCERQISACPTCSAPKEASIPVVMP